MSSPFRIFNGELFYVTHPPLDPALIEAGAINGLRKQGTDARRFEADCGDAQMLAIHVERQHNYPDGEQIGQLAANGTD